MRNLLLPLFLYALWWPLDAAAYFDPGSGMVMLQLLVAGGIGAAFRLRKGLRAAWQAIIAFFKK